MHMTGSMRSGVVCGACIAIAVLLIALALAGATPASTSREDNGREWGPLHYPFDQPPCWSADGALLYFGTNRIKRGVQPYLATFCLDMTTAQMHRVSPRGYYYPRLCPGGRQLLVVGDVLKDDDIMGAFQLDLQTGGIVRVQLGRREYQDLAPGPTEREVLFARLAATRRTPDIFALRFAEDGTIEKEWCILRDTEWIRFPSLSPDGRLLAYMTDSDPLERTYVAVLKVARYEDGKPACSFRLPPNGMRATLPRWFSDSRRIMLEAPQGPLIVDTTTGKAQDYRAYLRAQGKCADERIAAFNGGVPCPDGSDRVAFTVSCLKSNGERGIYLAVMDFDGGNFRQLTFDEPSDVPYPWREVQRPFLLERATELTRGE
jgi:Tol biopolymer transport system component